MGSSGLEFITCETLREKFDKCLEDVNYRILMLDIREASLYQCSHLSVEKRLPAIARSLRVINVDPLLMRHCTSKNILSMLEGRIKGENDTEGKSDLRVFGNRKDANDVVIIDSNTDNLKELTDPASKVMRLINGLTRFDVQVDLRIVVPITVLKGGYREWLIKYPHLTTNSMFDPDGRPNEPLKPITSVSVPIPTAPKPNIVRNAPGTAVPVTPIYSLRPTLPRSHSSPNVAAEGDELDDATSQFNRLDLSRIDSNQPELNNNNNTINLRPPPSAISQKPRFDRTLKPAFNNEFINSIRAQLDFGLSPEASGRVISGLNNLGNTCFMNSVVQCLAHAPGLVSYFCSDIYYSQVNFTSKDGTKGELAIEFGALVEKLNSHRHRYIEPRSFLRSITKHIGFAVNEQQDSHEFMMMLFEKLHHDLNIHGKDKYRQNGITPHGDGSKVDDNINNSRATVGYQFWIKHLELNKSIISDLFEGIFMSTLTCTHCRGQSHTFEVFNCLSLPIPSETRCQLRDCLNHFSNPERIEAAWECPRCKQKREADKKIVICKLPKILIIHLKRFSLDDIGRKKLQTTVDFPLGELGVDCTYVLPQSAYGSAQVRQTYSLYAVVNHVGNLDRGHYYAYCKSENNRWYKFDDSNVSEMKDSDVCGQAAYILFYETNG